ncbi:MAG: hypothetical protein DRI48_00980, partial [Chloroflexi bacterium]
MTAETEKHQQHESEPQGREEERARPNLLRRFWNRVTYVLAWLRNPDEIGQPITLPPRGVRLLVVLIAGNVLLLALLTIGLYRASTLPVTVQSPLVLPTAVVTVDPAPSPTIGPTPTPFGSGGAIAFTLRREGNADIYALNQSNLQLVRLTYDPAEDRDPAWSPDGNYVAFASSRADNWDIYLLDMLSGALIRLTHDPDFDGNPSWSPDGRWIAFESYRRGNLDIYVMSTTGQQLRRITNGQAPSYEPAWSPDSRAIAYTAFQDGNEDVYIQLLDDEGETVNLTQSPGVDESCPSWSPDGTRLAYVSGPRGNSSVHVMTLNGSVMATDQAHTELFGAGSSPTWAPDGHSLIYAYERGGRSHLVAASMAGWALFHEVYSVDGPLDDLAWTEVALSPRVVARARDEAPVDPSPLYVELVQSTPTAGPPYGLISLSNVTVQVSGEENGEESENEDREESEDGTAVESEGGSGSESENEARDTGRDQESFTGALLSDRVNESFNALRQRVIEEAGWDYLAELGLAQLPMDFTPY